jgi:hypothetical protein
MAERIKVLFSFGLIRAIRTVSWNLAAARFPTWHNYLRNRFLICKRAKFLLEGSR